MRSAILSSATNLLNLYPKIKESSSNGRWKEVLSHYREIKKTGFQLTDHTIFSHILKACLSLSYMTGKSIHASLIKQGFDSFTSVENSVMDFYSKSGNLASTVGAFNCMKTKDSVSWNIILHAHLDQGAFVEGLDLYMQARSVGFEPNISTLVLLIHTYRSIRAFADGQIFHGYLIQSGLLSLSSVQNSLLSMYTDISMNYAENLFDEMYEKDVISWSVMIRGYVHTNDVIFALKSFKLMISEFGIEPDGQTMVSVLKGCANIGDIRIGKSIHGYIIIRGLNHDLFIGNTLVDFYSKCNDVISAVTAFNEMPRKNVISWNSMLSGFVHNEKYTEALILFDSMRISGFDADEVTIVNLLLIYKNLGYLRLCKSIHSKILQKGLESNELAMNSLIDAYAKCNHIDISWRLFCQIEKPDIVTWSTMISGFTHCGMPDEAISMYRDMRAPHNSNMVTLLNLLEACTLSAEIRRSKWAHGIAVRMGLSSNVVVGTAILDMYSKCGAIGLSRKAFDQISTKNIVAWSAIIAAYGLNGLPHSAISSFYEMKTRDGIEPNSITILSVLSACCHGGLVEEGLSIFKEITKEKSRNELKVEHYSCLVDLLARAGKIDDALEIIEYIPTGMKPGASAWGSILSACRNYDNRESSEVVLSEVLELEPSSSAGYLLASNMYAVGGSWKYASGMRRLMKERGVNVVPGYSLVYVSNKAYTFTAGEKYHPLSRVFGPVIERLHACMKMDVGLTSLVT